MIFASIQNAIALWVLFSWKIVQNIPLQQQGQSDFRHIWPAEKETYSELQLYRQLSLVTWQKCLLVLQAHPAKPREIHREGAGWSESLLHVTSSNGTLQRNCTERVAVTLCLMSYLQIHSEVTKSAMTPAALKINP